MNEQLSEAQIEQIASFIERRKSTRRLSDPVTFGPNDDQLTLDDIRELKKVLGYARAGKIFWVLAGATGATIAAVVSFWDHIVKAFH